MPPIPLTYERNLSKLCYKSIQVCERFLDKNQLTSVNLRVHDEQSPFSACAYYRPDRGIVIYLPSCAYPALPQQFRAWSWPGNDTDRTPYGVVAHELGHHIDCLFGVKLGKSVWEYCSGWCSDLQKQAGMEKGLTSYAETNPAEWLAEAMRLFVVNPSLLRNLRPKTFAVIREHLKPVHKEGLEDWNHYLGTNVPDRIVTNLARKIQRIRSGGKP